MADSSGWIAAIEKEYLNRMATSRPSPFLFPLIQRTYGTEEVIAMVKVILSGQLTMAEHVRRFEAEFAQYVGSPYAVMVNSGSSGNLLALAAAVNTARQRHLKPGDEVLIPAVCWSTSLAPILQLDLKPVLVDVDPLTLNIDVVDLRRKITKNSRGLFLVHVLGNCAPMAAIMDIVQQHDLVLIEDTCESLGSRWEKSMLGTLGAFGSYSFYYSHHLTTGEGGMVTCKTLEDYDLLRCLRAHGWTRELSNRPALEKKYPDVDPRFLFVNTGFNLRPMEIQAAMGSVQLVRLPYMNSVRNLNRQRIVKAYESHPNYKGQFTCVATTAGADAAWFGFCVMLDSKFEHQLKDYLAHLTKAGIENRPIISGNFARQPMVRDIFPGISPRDYPGADAIGSRGFFIGLHVEPLSEESIEVLVDALLSFEFQAAMVILVTGGRGCVGQGLQKLIKDDAAAAGDARWVFLGKADGDLRDLQQCSAIFDKHRPTHVIHLAGAIMSSVGMAATKVECWEDNVAINNNVLHCARSFAVKKVVSCLSSWAYPLETPYPIVESALHQGPPPAGADTYAYSKRMLDVLSKGYREQYGLNFVTVLPTNIFGPGATFRTNGPVIEGAICKTLSAMDTNGNVTMFGTGKPVRQFIYNYDLAKLLVWTLHNYNDAETINFTGDEVSIFDIANLVVKLAGFQGKLEWDTSKGDGALKRTVSDEKLRNLYPEYKPTPFAEALEATVSWYKEEWSARKGAKP
eukprot:TRINITY_DN273_c0_g2_i1.p1 TRINITY_DN273_c0_g2~~TRINITY_DN273_c0_g2_i1.p1  ORF type:complete len:741 (+),score=281.80 TRINITY_DN273_c0_g2_i1:80-2302(+)